MLLTTAQQKQVVGLLNYKAGAKMCGGIAKSFDNTDMLVHDLTDNTVWSGGESDSKFTVSPASGKMIYIPCVQIVVSKDLDWHSPLIFQWIDGEDSVDSTVTFTDLDDLYDGCKPPVLLPSSDGPGSYDVLAFVYEFSKPCNLRYTSSAGVLKSLVTKITDDNKYETAASGVPEFVRVSFNKLREIDV